MPRRDGSVTHGLHQEAQALGVLLCSVHVVAVLGLSIRDIPVRLLVELVHCGQILSFGIGQLSILSVVQANLSGLFTQDEHQFNFWKVDSTGSTEGTRVIVFFPAGRTVHHANSCRRA